MTDSTTDHATSVLADYAKIAPVEYVSIINHPLEDPDVVANFSVYGDTIEVCAPRCIFADNAKSFAQLNTTDFSNLANVFNLAMELAGYVANKISSRMSEMDMVPPVVAVFSAVPKKAVLEADDDDDESAAAQTAVDDEVVCDPRDIVCYRLRVVMQSAVQSVGAIIDDLIEDNEMAAKKQLRTGRTSRRSQREYAYKRMNRLAYIRMCVVYSGDDKIDVRRANSLPLWDDNNPVNPTKIFTVERSMKIAKAFGASDKTCDINQYSTPTHEEEDFVIPDYATMDANKQHTSATAMPAAAADDDDGDDENGDGDDRDPEPTPKRGKKGMKRSRYIKIKRYGRVYAYPCGGYNAYIIQTDHIRPHNQARYFFPHMTKQTFTKISLEEQVYRLAVGIPVGRPCRLYSSCVNVDAMAVEPNDLDHLRKRQLARIAGIKIPKSKLTEYTAEYDRLTLIGLKEWETIYNTEGDIADSIKVICKWDRVHLETHPNFCMPLPLVTRNLSRIANFFASFNMSLETIWGVSSLNNEIISGWVGDMRVYMVVPFQVHTILCGLYAAGKTFVNEVQMSMLIPLTFTESAYESDKAKAVEGKAFDMQPEFFPELPPHMIGVSEGGAKTTGANANTMAESLLKMRLTSGKMVARVKQVTEDGKHISVEIVCYCNVKFNGCSNVMPDEIPAAVRSRFYISEIQKGSERKDCSTPVEKNVRAMNPVVIAAKKVFQYRQMRTQSLVSKIMTLISAGVLPPVSMTASMSILLETMKRAKLMGLSQTDAVRNIERVVFHMQVIAILNAIDIVFDSEMSTLAGKEPPIQYKTEHLLLVKPFLVSHAEHVGIALSLLYKQFESPILANVIKAMKRHFNGVRPAPGMLALGQGRGGQQVLNSSSSNRDDYSGFAHMFDDTAAASSSGAAAAAGPPPASAYLSRSSYSVQDYSQPAWVNSDGGRIAILARELYATMIPQPSVESIRSVLIDMNKMLVPAGDPANPQHKVAMLSFGVNQRGFAWTAVETPDQKDKLADAFISVMSYPTAPLQTFLYAKGDPLHPYILKVMRNNPQPQNEDVIMHDPNYYDETMIRLTQVFTAGIDDERFDAPQHPIDWNNVFSTNADATLVGSADEFSALSHVHALGMPASLIKSGPPIFPSTQMAVCLLKYDAEYISQLPVYPKCFIRIINGNSILDRNNARVPTSDIVAVYKRALIQDEVRQTEKARKKRHALHRLEGQIMEEEAVGDISEESILGVQAVCVPSPDAFFCDADMVEMMRAPVLPVVAVVPVPYYDGVMPMEIDDDDFYNMPMLQAAVNGIAVEEETNQTINDELDIESAIIAEAAAAAVWE